MGTAFFENRKLSDVIRANEYANMPDFVKKFLELKPVEKDIYINNEKTGKKKTVYNANPYRLQLLKALPTTRMVSYLYQIFRDEESLKTKAINVLTGVKVRPIDLKEVEYFRDRDNRRALEDLLIDAGVIKRFENIYIPKK